MSKLETYKFTATAGEDYSFWLETDLKTTQRLNVLIKDILEAPFIGLGKGEALKYSLSGLWSRRINRRHRLIYRIVGGDVEIISCRYHYE
jgi:toxin YoeB